MPDHVVWHIELDVPNATATVLTLVAHPDVIGLDKHGDHVVLTLAEGVANLTNLPTWGSLSTHGGSGYHADSIIGGVRVRLNPVDATAVFMRITGGPDRRAVGDDSEEREEPDLPEPRTFWNETTIPFWRQPPQSLLQEPDGTIEPGWGFTVYNITSHPPFARVACPIGFCYIPSSYLVNEATAVNPNGGPDIPIWTSIIDGGETPPDWFIPSGMRVQTGVRTDTHVHVTFAFEGLQGNGYIPLEYIEEDSDEPHEEPALRAHLGPNDFTGRGETRVTWGVGHRRAIAVWREIPDYLEVEPDSHIDPGIPVGILDTGPEYTRIAIQDSSENWQEAGYVLNANLIQETIAQQIARMPQPIMIGVGYPEPYWTLPPEPGTPSEGNLERELVHVEQVLGDALRVRTLSTNRVLYVMPNDPDTERRHSSRNIQRLSRQARARAITPRSRWDLIGDPE